MWTVLTILLLSFTPGMHARFPQGSCQSKSCSGSPVRLTWNPTGGASGTDTVKSEAAMCFQVASQPCLSNSKFDCCAKFQAFLNKIVLPIDSACLKAVSRVTVDGVRKGGGVYPINTTSGSELHLTALGWTAESAIGKTVCIYTSDPNCNTVGKLCKDAADGLCKFSIYDAIRHECCPTCPFTWVPSPGVPDADADAPPVPAALVGADAPPVPGTPMGPAFGTRVTINDTMCNCHCE